MSKLITFQRFVTYEEAAEAASVLRAHGIEAETGQDPALLDQNFVGQRYDNYIELKIPGSDFKRALQLLVEANPVNLEDVPADYLLLSFSTAELKDVIAKPDEWGAYNYNIALALLRRQGEAVITPNLEATIEERNIELSKPRELSSLWYFFGYGFSVIGIVARIAGNTKALWLLYGFYGLPGILGIILGAYILFTKRTLPDGTRINSFSAPARKQGLYMLLLGTATWLLVLLMGLLFASPSEDGF